MSVVPMKHDDDFFEHNSKATEARAKSWLYTLLTSRRLTRR
jgi:hypothetical protein